VIPEFIQSRQNPRVQNLARLRERAGREAQGRFLVEGLRELERALLRPGTIEDIYFCPDHFRGEEANALLDRAAAAGIPVCHLAALAFEKVSLREGPDGLLGVARAWKSTLEELKLSANPLLLLLEHVEKPGNLGALLRSADAAGVDAVIVCDPVTDLFNPNVVRNSQGTLFSLPVVVAESAAALAFLRQRNIAIVATTPDSKHDYWEIDLRGPVALALGGEKNGLTTFWIEAADHRARIPMAGLADSLNVAAAAAIALYEAVRQRRATKSRF
jgi:TrmH family RNA methyltransferase